MIDNLTPRKSMVLSIVPMGVVLLFLVLYYAPNLAQADLPNPDSFYRLVLVREFSLQTGFQYMARDNAPIGFYQHWSAPYSWVLLKTQQVLQWIGLPQDAALIWGGAAITVVSMLALAALVAKIAIDQGGMAAAVVAVITLISSGGLWGYGKPVQITHHVFMLVPIAAAAVLMLPSEVSDRRSRLIGLGVGGLLGFALWISPEMMPLVAGLTAVSIASRIQAVTARATWPIAIGLVTLLTLAWVLDPPPPTFSAWALDHISLAWLSFGGLLFGFLLVADLVILLRLNRALAFVTTVAVGVLAGVIWLFLVPEALHGPAGLIPPELKAIWWDQIVELKPAQSLPEFFSLVGMSAFSGILLIFLALKQRLMWMAVLGLMAIAYSILGAMHVRSGAAAGLLGAICYGLALARLAAFRKPSGGAIAFRSEKLALLLMFLPLIQLIMAFVPEKDGAIGVNQTSSEKACKLAEVAGFLNTLPSGTFLTPINDGPELLWRTQHRIIAGNYHHNIAGLKDHFDIWESRDPDVRAKDLARKRDIDYFLMCASKNPITIDRDKWTLAQRMSAGQSIEWLSSPAKIGGWWFYKNHH